MWVWVRIMNLNKYKVVLRPWEGLADVYVVQELQAAGELQWHLEEQDAQTSAVTLSAARVNGEPREEW